ncbi:MAG: 16S rRNA (cytidine(1402)-2'-O)-methyltransferase [Halanaerobiales bacterium]|nr:16S rRNA (cytidine(1402)-2'-O)-methyltransferase [Halanaerobiales bacterium]
MSNQAKLYICGTPIGNLDDITFRAIEILKSVDLIAAEDTRRTSKLLNHFQIKNKVTSYHEHNEQTKSVKLIDTLKEGKQIALVSDAGMPGISDPGLILIKKAIKAGIEVVPIPGPTALISGLIVSGLDTEKFSFLGFIPRKGKQRDSFIENLINEEMTVIFYDSPHRTKDSFKELTELIPDRKAALIREITKLHEEKIYGSISEISNLIENRELKGEVVIIIEGKEKKEPKEDNWAKLSILEHVQLFMDNNFTKKEAISEVAKVRDIQKKKVYKEAIKINVNR